MLNTLSLRQPTDQWDALLILITDKLSPLMKYMEKIIMYGRFLS